MLYVIVTVHALLIILAVHGIFMHADYNARLQSAASLAVNSMFLAVWTKAIIDQRRRQ